MPTWYSLNIGHAADCEQRTRDIQQAFAFFHMTSGAPIEMAMFSYKDLSDMSITLYFSPPGAPFAQSIGASPCSRPDYIAVKHPIFGDSRCVPLLWPELAQADESYQ